MKKLRIFPLVSCLLILCSYGISLADETSAQQCINSCDEKLQICLNINADRSVCEAEFQDCVKSCEPESDSPSPTEQDSNSDSTVPQ
jgi:hypothetical protein